MRSSTVVVEIKNCAKLAAMQEIGQLIGPADIA